MTAHERARAAAEQQRTHRYLRLGIGATVVVILAAVVAASLQGGFVLGSISAYFYTPARSLFVGALIAASIGILALSGTGWQRGLLDAAAVVAPLVAFVPTPIQHGAVPGFPDDCPTQPAGVSCVPADQVPAIAIGVEVYLALSLPGIVLAIVAAILPAADRKATARMLAPSFAATGVILGATTLGWFGARELFLAHAHFVAAALFFLLIALVALVNAIAPRLDEPRQARVCDATLTRRAPWLGPVYWVIAVALLLDVAVITVAVIALPSGITPPPVLIGELIALALFLVFWALQSYQTWVDDERGRRSRRSGA
ncbi:MAG: hypothetical protein J0G30_06380 [Actinomycetales bacterium]|nr:hypothetical protein [Actinomycetales bacterium]